MDLRLEQEGRLHAHIRNCRLCKADAGLVRSRSAVVAEIGGDLGFS